METYFKVKQHKVALNQGEGSIRDNKIKGETIERGFLVIIE